MGKENENISYEHYHSIFNCNTAFDLTTLNELKQKLEAVPILVIMMHQVEEVKIAIMKMKNNKSPGMSGLTMAC